MKLRFTALALALFGISSAASAAGPTDNGVYRIVNVGYQNAMTAAGAGNITCTAINESDEAQLWVAEAKRDGEGFYMRNYKTGYYMTSSRARSKAWQAQFTIMPDDNNILLNFIPTGSSFFINTVNATGKTDDEGTHGFAHENSGRTVVGWNVNTDNSKWDLVEQTDITAADLAAKKATWLSCVSDIEPGKAYRIRNYHYGHALVPGKNQSLIGGAADDSDINQVWIVEQNPVGEGYFLRHYQTGMVVASSCLREKAWSVQDLYVPDQAASAMYFTKRPSGFGISTLSTRGLTEENADYTFAHENNQSVILGYILNSNPSVWLFTPVEEITSADIAAKTLTWDCFKKNTVDNALAAIFTDFACTELTPEYAAKTPEALATDPNVLALPEGLRPMVRKILTGDWSETDPYNGNQWDSPHARKLRVQMVEPFSHCGHAASLACIQAYGDLNNPTGIVTDNGTVLYVMVDKEPADGSTLYIAGRTGEGTPLVTLNNTTDGFRLRKGLNVVPCDKDLADMIVYYSVRTTTNRNRLRHVTDYEDIKIHIEGGSLNGYFNYEGDALYTPDTNEDWLYYRERARHAMFTLMSKYTTLYIHFNDIFDEDGKRTQCLKSLCSPEAYEQGRYDLRATMKAWDELYVAETMLMGLLGDDVIEAEKAAGRDFYNSLSSDPVARDDYRKYFNNRHLGISLRECGFMNATWYRTAYNPGTIGSIIREFPKGDMWGPAHEFGHLNQGPICIAGTTEESNNLFSNVAMYYRGTHTSRADLPSVQRDRFNKGQNFHQHGTWGTTRMWFQLWLYYHATGHDKNFYPRLFELLRNNPLRRTRAPGHDDVVNPLLAKDDLLHFAKMACIAAGEDLTDFFEAWGFFVVQDGYYIGDYTSYTSYLSADDIAEWKAEIASLAAENGWKKNTAIIFIDDRVGSTRQSYGGFDKNKCGSMGGLKDFTEGAPVTGEYSFTVAGNTIEMSGGSGGVGFLIYDSEGKLIGFANEPVFTISDEAAALLREGKASVVVVDAGNEETKVVDAVNDGNLEQRLQAMDVLLRKVESILAESDPEGRKAGYLKPETMADLQAAYDDVKAKRDAGEITADNNVELYNALYAVFTATGHIDATADNTIPVTPGGIYVFTSNILYPGKGITANTAGTQLANVAAGNVDMDDQAQQWVFEPADEENYYYIRNVKYNKYIGKAAADKGAVTLVSEPMKQLVLFRELGGLSVSPLGSDHDSLHDDGNGRLTRWDSSAKASRWTLTLVENWEAKVAMAELIALISRAEALLDEAGTVTETEDGIVAEPKVEYQFVTPDMMTELYALVKAAYELKENPDATAEDITALCDDITVACDELFKALNRNHDRLEELIEKTRELAALVGNVSEVISPVALTGEDMYSNAPHTGNGSDKFTTWDVLFDNNYNTFFHSSYANANTPDGLDHYIRIKLPEVPQESADFIFSYVTRKNNDYNWMPAEATLEYSADGENWHTIADLSDELAVGSAYLFESEPFTVPAGTGYIRFMVHKNRQSATNAAIKKAGGHCYFVLSELGLYDYDLKCEALTEDYPSSDTAVIRAAMIRARAAEQVLARRDYGQAQYDAAYEDLLPHYEALLAIYDDPAGIEDITIDNTDDLRDAVIYTIGGIRIRKITVPGIYIINGKKVMVR